MLTQFERRRFTAGDVRKRSEGLIHMMPMDTGCAVPHPILLLEFSLIIVELNDKVCFSSTSTCTR